MPSARARNPEADGCLSFDRYDPGFVALFRPALGWLYEKYFRVDFHGVHNVPDGPVLFVGNHNGLVGFEIPMLLEGWLRVIENAAEKGESERRRLERRILGLAHSYVFVHPFFRSWIGKLGAIEANHDRAREALQKGYSVLVYPGGDLEASRPWKDRSKVIFSGRQGYARLALEAGVPIVPVANIGGHDQVIILARLDGLARALGFDADYRFHGVPLTLRSLPFVPGLFFKRTRHAAFVSMFAAPAVPLPAKMDYFFEAPVQLSGDERRALSHEEQVARLDQRTRDVLQDRLTREYARRPLPWI